MKKVLLIGDSIRMGYAKYVQEALTDAAEVYYSCENARFSTFTFRFVSNWKTNENWPDDIDLIHWNVGLWDVLRVNGEEPLTPPDCYRENLGKIHRRLAGLFPKAKTVFATSTNVVEKRYGKEFSRKNADIEEYNEIAKEVMKQLSVPVNDLYALTKDLPDEYRSVQTHFATPIGTKLLGDRVVSVICRQLGIDAKDVKIENFSLEKFTEEQLGL